MSLEHTKREAQPSTEFDPFTSEFDVNPYPMLEKLRAQPALPYWETGHGWLLSRYEDAIAVLRDSKRFTANRAVWEFDAELGLTTQIPELQNLSKYGLFALASADHARVRKLVSPALTPRAIERLRPEIQAIVDEILDGVEAKGTLNVVTEVAARIPARVIGSMLKIPKGREALFQRFTEAMIKSFVPGLVCAKEMEAMRPDIAEGLNLVRETVEDRRRHPLEEDILTTLIRTEERGDSLSAQELLSLVAALIVGGFETTVHLISFTVYNLLQRPEVLAQVKAEPGLTRNVIEEVLRFDNFGKTGLARYALEDVALSGVTIKKGQLVLVMLGSALRDEGTFSSADVFDVRRNTNASLAFGHGAHYCIGASLARLEVQLTVSTLVQRFPQMKLLAQPSFGPHPVLRKMESLEVQLRPR
ncbi:cytochrome P450 [Stigmatella sp. ncwal1]|uniref:Cytochrome P450 n=1 Tax=Stigmatella ashevillensis TaxID=2995309 RepID=A0ABT5D6H2_9BACT|nr:cytochrome P450 [Stigmatella ashevillena]MDC0708669.1 cytochrome P450 [Stigmatella ashevillena]